MPNKKPTPEQCAKAGYIKGRHCRYSFYGDHTHYRTLTGVFVWYQSKGHLVAETAEHIGMLIFKDGKFFDLNEQKKLF